MTISFGSLCSGIEAASVAWQPLGWKAAWFSEIESFPATLLAHRYPDVVNLGDMRSVASLLLNGKIAAPDVLCGGTPCQAFSVAGQRRSLDDERGNLTLTFCEIADATDRVRVTAGRAPSVIFWENVPGVLNTKDNAFGCFLGALAGENDPLVAPGGRWSNAGCVYGPKRTVAWRILDAQYFGVAQRRRRVFVVASARNGFDPAAVLFEFDGVRRDHPPRREAREGFAPRTARSVAIRGRDGTPQAELGDEVANALLTPSGGRGGIGIGAILEASTGDVSHCLNAGGMGRQDYETETLIAHSLRGEGFDASEDGTGQGTPLVPVAFPANMSATQHAAAEDRAPSLCAKNPTAVASLSAVRRLTPRECERLQGFPDDYTLIPLRNKKPTDVLRFSADGPRYKALGNSWAVPCVRWIGERIARQIS